MNESHSLPNWIAYIFDHSVTEPAWHLSLDAPEWQDSPEHILSLIAETFERSGELLSRFSDAQLNQAFWFLVSISSSGLMFPLSGRDVPAAIRLRVFRSFVPLFKQVMAPRCSPHLSHLDEKHANPLNSACYMWWEDIMPGKPADAEFDAEVLRVLSELLAIPHDACRESALHGIGHWQRVHPDIAATIVDDFLSRTPHLRPELISYAQRAKAGEVQ